MEGWVDKTDCNKQICKEHKTLGHDADYGGKARVQVDDSGVFREDFTEMVTLEKSLEGAISVSHMDI